MRNANVVRERLRIRKQQKRKEENIEKNLGGWYAFLGPKKRVNSIGGEEKKCIKKTSYLGAETTMEKRAIERVECVGWGGILCKRVEFVRVSMRLFGGGDIQGRKSGGRGRRGRGRS